MAGGAIGKRQIPELDIRFRVIDFRMTLLTVHFEMRPAKNIASPLMVELHRVFPSRGGMAGSAVRGELPAMFVLVAAAAFHRQPQPGPAQVLYQDSLGAVGTHMRGLVTGFARERNVFALKGITGPAVIEF